MQSKLIAVYKACKHLKADFAKEDTLIRTTLHDFKEKLNADAFLLVSKTAASHNVQKVALQAAQATLRKAEVDKSLELGRSLQREEDALGKLAALEKELAEARKALSAGRSQEASKQAQQLSSLLTELELQRQNSSSDAALLTTLQKEVTTLNADLSSTKEQLSRAKEAYVNNNNSCQRRAEISRKLVRSSRRFCSEASEQIGHELRAFASGFASDCKLLEEKLKQRMAKDRAARASEQRFKVRCKKEILRLRNKLRSEMNRYSADVERVRKEVTDKVEVAHVKAQKEAKRVQELEVQNAQFKEDLQAMARIKSAMSKVKSMLAFHSKLNDRFEQELGALKQRYEEEKLKNERRAENEAVLRDRLACMEQEVRMKNESLTSANEKLKSGEEAFRSKFTEMEAALQEQSLKLESAVAKETAKSEEIKRLESAHAREIEVLQEEISRAKNAADETQYARTVEGMETHLQNLSNIVRSKDNDIRVLEATVEKERFERKRLKDVVDRLMKRHCGMETSNERT